MTGWSTVHVVEPGGSGGVHQHAATVAGALADAGVPVVLHTAADAEELDVDVCRHDCFWRFAHLSPRPLRRAAVAGAWVVGGVPSCVARFRPGDVVHLQGWFVPALMLPLAAGARLRRCSLAYSPHNTFSRRDRPAEERVARWLARRADVVFAFSEVDRRRIRAWGAHVVQVPMVTATPDPDAALVAAWRRRWGVADGRRAVLLFGQLRPDKGLDVAVRAAARWPDDAVLAVVGEDVGALAGARRLARELGVRVEVDEGYLPLCRLVAAVAAADLVVCPYRRGSQSAALAMAAGLGRPTVASAVGGMAELATVTVPPGDVEALAAAVERLLEHPARPAPRRPDVAAAYINAYGLGSEEARSRP